MAVINILITDAGLAEVINAEQNGTAPVVLTEVGLGTGQYTPSADQTALRSEFKRLSTIAGGSIGDNAIHLTASDESDDAYTVYEFGIYTASGTLFAVFSQPVAILQKAAAAHALLAMDIVVTNIDPDSVAVGNTNFQLNSATTTKQGIVELATAAEVVAGTDGFRAVTPSALTARTATTGRTGLVELATTAETQAGKDTERAVTPAALKTELDVRESRVVHTVNSVGPDSAGNVSIVNITGNAGTATKLATPVTINGVNFDGSESITVEDASKLPKDGTAAAATKLAAAHTINGVSFDGTADITIADSTKAPKSHASSATTYGVSSASNYGHAKASGTTPKANGTAAVGSETSSFARGDHVHPLQTSVTGSSGSCTGNAETATKLATARKINGVSFDGTTDITVADNTKLPLSGGTMRGGIIFPCARINSADNDTFKEVWLTAGQNWGEGGMLSLFKSGSSNNPGGFKLEAFKNGAPSASLVGTPEGSLTWGNSNVVTEASGNAATATTAAKLGMSGNSGIPMTFYWDGRNGQPSWVWGGDNGHDMYVYNPSAFNVNYANSAYSATAMPNVYFNSGKGDMNWTLPDGGSWRCFLMFNQAQTAVVRVLAGGAVWSESPGSLPWFAVIVRIG